MRYQVRGSEKDSIDIIELREITRSRLAGMVGVVCVALLAVSAAVSYVTESLSYLEITAAIIGMPLGMVLQYYFGGNTQ